MKVSIIIPNYNHSAYLKQRIDSVLNQTFTDYELIILDDASTDNSRDIINALTASHPEIKCHFNEKNSGSPFVQWDLGVSLAKGEYIWIAESDDFASEFFLEKTTRLLDLNSNVGMVFCEAKVYDEKNKIEYYVSEKRTLLSRTKWTQDYLCNGTEEIENFLCLVNTISNTSGVLFRKSKYLEAGLANHSMKYCGDWFLYIRILLNSDIAYIAEPLNNFRLHSNSTFHSYFASRIYLKEVLKIYSFTSGNVRLTLWKKSMMTLNLVKIANRYYVSFLKKAISGIRLKTILP
jgi:glycosyltransferase involved in cell wall biosynthesis